MSGAGWGAAANLIDSGLNFAGGLIQSGQNSRNIAKQIAYQKEFAQNGIRWRVADAKAAGIHPLAALGAQTTGFTPVSIGDNGIANAFSAMGQGIDRAITAKQTEAERVAEQKYVDATRTVDLQMKAKQIELLDAEIAQNKANTAIALRRAQTPPAMPMVETPSLRKTHPSLALGQGDVLKRGLSSPFPDYGGNRARVTRGFANDGNPIPMFQIVESPSGYRDVVQSSDYQQLFDDKLILEWVPFVQSLLEQIFGMPNHYWSWSRGWRPKSERRLNHLLNAAEVSRAVKENGIGNRIPSWYYRSPGL